MRVDALFPAVRAFRSQPQPLGRTEDRVRLEVRRLEQHVGRRLGDLRFLPAHDPGERDGAFPVGDHQVGRLELAQKAVERPELLPLAGTAHDDPPLGQRRMVERVQRIAEREHGVIRHVDDVGDRPHAGIRQPCAQPRRRRADARAAKEPPHVARAALEILHPDVDHLVAGDAGIAAGRRRKLEVVDRGHLARDAVHGHEVGAVAGGLDEENVLDERERIGERRAGLPLLGKNHDPRVVRAERDLVLGEDHPVRQLAAELGRLEGRAVREYGSGQRHRHRRAGAEVPRAADDLTRLALTDVDLAELQPVRVRMLPRLEHAADEEAAQIAVRVGDAAAFDTLDLRGRDAEPLRQIR